MLETETAWKATFNGVDFEVKDVRAGGISPGTYITQNPDGTFHQVFKWNINTEDNNA